MTHPRWAITVGQRSAEVVHEGVQTPRFVRKSVVSRLGFEPRTRGLKVPCSATELTARGIIADSRLDRDDTCESGETALATALAVGLVARFLPSGRGSARVHRFGFHPSHCGLFRTCVRIEAPTPVAHLAGHCPWGHFEASEPGVRGCGT